MSMMSVLVKHQVGNRFKITELLASKRPYMEAPTRCPYCAEDDIGTWIVFTDTAEVVLGQDGEPWIAGCRKCNEARAEGYESKYHRDRSANRPNRYLSAVP